MASSFRPFFAVIVIKKTKDLLFSIFISFFSWESAKIYSALFSIRAIMSFLYYYTKAWETFDAFEILQSFPRSWIHWGESDEAFLLRHPRLTLGAHLNVTRNVSGKGEGGRRAAAAFLEIIDGQKEPSSRMPVLSVTLRARLSALVTYLHE